MEHFFIRFLSIVPATIYSFHHEDFFFPPWWKETFTTMERNFLHGGKNKDVHFVCLTVANGGPERNLFVKVWESRDVLDVDKNFEGYLFIITRNHIFNMLPPRQQEVYRLSREKHLTYKEIASDLHISEKTVEHHISDALKFLKKNLLIYFLFVSL